MNYTNFIVRLRNWNYGQFQVEVINSPVGRMRYPDVVRFNSSILHTLDKLANPGTEDRLTKEDLIDLGEALGDMLFPPTVRRLFQKSLAYLRQKDFDNWGLRLLLEVDDPLLSILPWEYVYLWEYAYLRGRAARNEETDPMDGFLARDALISMVRHESFIAIPEQQKVEAIETLNVLVGMAEPTGFGEDLNLEKEFDVITRALSSNEAPGEWDNITLKAEERHLTPARLKAICQQDLHIFHFSGHGGFFPEALVDEQHRLQLGEAQEKKPSKNGQGEAGQTKKKAGRGGIGQGRVGPGRAHRGAIVLETSEDDTGPYILWSDTLARTLKQGNIQVVVLSACQSATRDPRKLVWTGVAPALLKAGIPAVVAMQFGISDSTAILFSEHFYWALSLGLSLEEAVAFGRRAIMDLDDDKRDQDWGVPVLYTRAEEGVRFPGLKTNEVCRDFSYVRLFPDMYETFQATGVMEYFLYPFVFRIRHEEIPGFSPGATTTFAYARLGEKDGFLSKYGAVSSVGDRVMPEAEPLLGKGIRFTILKNPNRDGNHHIKHIRRVDE